MARLLAETRASEDRGWLELSRDRDVHFRDTHGFNRPDHTILAENSGVERRLSGSRRTESVWMRTTVFAKDDTPVATMLLNMASIKDSYANYEQEHKALYG